MTDTLPSPLLDNLRSMEDVIEQIVVRACEAETQRSQHEWVDREVRESFDELKWLRQGKDLAYDRPSIGIQYAYWYHLQRTHELVRILGPRYLGASGELTVVDLGSGTGATAWAIALLSGAAEQARITWPRTHVVGIEVSPFMLHMAEVLWQELQSGALIGSTSSEFRLGSWAHERAQLPTDLGDHLVVASYLFDASDQGRMEELAERLTLTCRMHGYRNLLFASAAAKSQLVSTFGEAVGADWAVTTPEIGEIVWTGSLDGLAAARARFLAPAGDLLQTKTPSWSYRDPSVVEINLTGERLFETPRVSLTYDPVQDEAAEPSDRLTAIIGAAGSGKSRVLCERLVRTLEAARPPDTKHALVTSFNKAMVDQLAAWTIERLESSEDISRFDQRRCEAGWWEFTVTNAVGATSAVTMMNRDKLPHRVFGVHHREVISSWYTALASHRHLVSRKDPDLVGRVSKHTDDFLAAEFERIFLGEGPLERATYVDSEFIRRGRGKPVRTVDRPDIWDYLMNERPAHFLTRRLEAVERHAAAVQTGERVMTDRSYSDVFVDECQDFTPAEIRLLARVSPDPKRLCVAGDETQSVHLGASYRRPAIQGAVWEIHRLEGSYRLPARVCEAIRPLADAVMQEHRSRDSGADGVTPEMRKSASPGPRPVLVHGSSNTSGVVEAIRVLARYVPENDQITIVPGRTHFKDTGMASVKTAIEEAGFNVEVRTMLDIKGLERELVLFPTDNTSHGDESTLEWVYTALTRSVGVVMIVIFENTPPDTAAALSLLDPDHLLFWDSEARQVFESLTN